ncbi:choice-of-anchor B family protein [Gracilimonas halophila]|uniref:Choice-of-anchor B family protein n=1 Tax=Gracilimonas halophila TaxID=1834464 RepID=A0ABW5JDS6_9BACT
MRNKLIFGIIFVLFLGGAVSCNLNNSEDDSRQPVDLGSTLQEAPFLCDDGFANGFPCENVNFYAQVSIPQLSGQSSGVFLNDIWGWTDPETEKEYALVGLTNGMSFVDISDPINPVVVGRLPESNLIAKYKTIAKGQYPACNLGLGQTQRSKSITEGSSWRDVKVYEDHAYIVSDNQPHGMQVLDLTKLRNYSGEILNLQHDFLYDRLASAHNIVINEESGFAFATGVTQADMCGSNSESGLHMIDLTNPRNPEFAGCYIDDTPGYYRIAPGYIHDAQCVNYNGPDSEHQGKEVCFNSAEGNIVITDVSDKQNPTTIGFNRQADMQYSHQGWLTEDQSYFLMNDELDERNLGRGTKTYIWDVQDLEAPEFLGYYEHSTSSIDHNLFIKGNYVYQSNYNAGLQILDITDVAAASIERVAYFDTQPNTDAANFNGTWSNYPFFKSGLVILSDIESGLFIVKPELE